MKLINEQTNQWRITNTTITLPVAGTAAAASSFGLFLSNRDPVRIDPVSSDFNLNAPNDWTNENMSNENVISMHNENKNSSSIIQRPVSLETDNKLARTFYKMLSIRTHFTV